MLYMRRCWGGPYPCIVDELQDLGPTGGVEIARHGGQLAQVLHSTQQGLNMASVWTASFRGYSEWPNTWTHNRWQNQGFFALNSLLSSILDSIDEFLLELSQRDPKIGFAVIFKVGYRGFSVMFLLPRGVTIHRSNRLTGWINTDTTASNQFKINKNLSMYRFKRCELPREAPAWYQHCQLI